MLLGERGLLPEPEMIGDDRGARLYGINALKRCVLVGALQAAGVELLLAARLVEGIAEEMEPAYGTIPSNLMNLIRGAGVNLARVPGDLNNDYWLHRALIGGGEYRPGVAYGGDFLLEVADRRYVFMGALGLRTHGGMDATFRVSGWERGSEATITHIASEAGTLGTPEGDTRLEALRQEYQSARDNALGLLRINCGLAIRTGLDRIAVHRGDA